MQSHDLRQEFHLVLLLWANKIKTASSQPITTTSNTPTNNLITKTIRAAMSDINKPKWGPQVSLKPDNQQNGVFDSGGKNAKHSGRPFFVSFSFSFSFLNFYFFPFSFFTHHFFFYWIRFQARQDVGAIGVGSHRKNIPLWQNRAFVKNGK